MSVNLILKTTSIYPTKPIITDDYTFRVKGNSAIVPTTDVKYIPFSNTGGVTMYNDPIRGYVFHQYGYPHKLF